MRDERELVEFLQSRVDEDRRGAKSRGDDRVAEYCDAAEAIVHTYMGTWNEMQRHPNRDLGVVETPDLARTQAGDVTLERVMGRLDALLLAVRRLATVYADHPDYDEAWRPS